MGKLFTEFSGVDSKRWKQQIQYELKGGDYQDLVWESPEGIKVRPFYHADEEMAPYSVSGRGPFAICQEIFVFDVDKSAARAIDSINRGSEEIRFIIPDANTDINKLIADLPLETARYFELRFLSEDCILKLDNLAAGRKVYCLVDPIHQLMTDGNWFPGDDNLKMISSLTKKCTNMSMLSVDGRIYQNAGANIVQQIAYTISHLVEYLNEAEKYQNEIVLQLSVGTNYFFEIAKLRALRILFASIASEFGITADCKILATPTKRNKTLYDYNVNMLRTTTECMSAILGGSDSISNLPYDAIYHKSNEFGERIARNQLLILKHESYFDKTLNAADGSYYIGNLTDQLAEKALILIKEIESAGGFIKQLKDGTIQKKIIESAAKEQSHFDSGSEILVGTNKYPNKNDRMSDDLELFPFVKHHPRKTLITPIAEKRLAEKTEQERLNSEKP